jgi:hypothetical protein
VGDIDNDGLDDMVVGGDSYNQAQVFSNCQTANSGSAICCRLQPSRLLFKDAGLLLFDANGDGKPDLYVASGGYESRPTVRNTRTGYT